MKRLALLFLLFAASTVHAMPVEIDAEYKLTNLGILIGRVTEKFQRDGDRYSIQSVSRSEGVLKIVLDDSLTLESHGLVNTQGLQPLVFEQRRRTKSDRDIRATFDWEKGVLHSLYQGKVTDVALPKATQDRVSILYQFMNLGSTATPSVEMHMSNGRKVELYTYRFVEESRLKTPAGEFDTVHYERVRASEKDPRTDVWLAKDRFNVPVRVVFDDPRGLKVEQTITDLKVR